MEAEIAFKHAVFRENMYGAKFNLVPIIKNIDATNTYEAEEAGKSKVYEKNFEDLCFMKR